MLMGGHPAVRCGTSSLPKDICSLTVDLRAAGLVGGRVGPRGLMPSRAKIARPAAGSLPAVGAPGTTM
eukprot:806857-Pyramimonas_sp.AAC.1